MQAKAFQSGNAHPSPTDSSPPESSLCKVILRNSIWVLGILTWLVGVFERGYVAFLDGAITIAHLAQLLTAAILFSGWLYLKPENSPRNSRSVAFEDPSAAFAMKQSTHLDTIQARMSALQKHHVVGREYILPFPYLCQIYHLLNLKHLETIHSFSLNNLKVVSVSDLQPTAIGGTLRFQTMLDSPLNILRLWRQSTVEVALTLHTPFTVELQVPVRHDKTIHVIFNVLPLSQNEHRLYVDIYSNLPWPKSLLRFVLEFATSLTLLEDLPYLRKLTARKQQNLLRPNAPSDRALDASDTLQLYRRYVNLYSPTPAPAAPPATRHDAH